MKIEPNDQRTKEKEKGKKKGNESVHVLKVDNRLLEDVAKGRGMRTLDWKGRNLSAADNFR